MAIWPCPSFLLLWAGGRVKCRGEALRRTRRSQVEEKAASFYLGKEYDVAKRQVLPEAVLYDARGLTTHAICLGMTGSGKTGLALVLLEEAALDGIPCILIDPKGDLGNLLLTFPHLRPEDF